MSRSAAAVLRDQGRGITGALMVVGIAVLYTLETWHLAWQLPMWYLVTYALFGLAATFLVTATVGFREADERDDELDLSHAVTDFAELVFQSFVAAYVTLLAMGVVRLDDSPATIARLGLIQVVPLGFGAAVSNRLLAQSDREAEEKSFPGNLATFAFGALFFTFPLAPTEEVVLVVLRAGWARLAALVVLSVLVVNLVLYELQFRGHGSRTEDVPTRVQVGTSFVVYAVGVAVSVVLLAAFGRFDGVAPTVAVGLTIVLGFPASVGGAAGEVVL